MMSDSRVSPADWRHVSQCSINCPAMFAPWQPMAVLAADMRAARTSGLGSDNAPDGKRGREEGGGREGGC